MLGQARDLARWVGRGGRPVTASRVLRRVDVSPAGDVLGAAVPARVRTAADVPVLHRPWSFAVGAGLLEIDSGVAVAGPLLERWSSLDDPFAGLVDLLGQLGAVTGDGGKTVAVTALGRWAVADALADRPRTITADLRPGEVVELLANCVRRGVDPWSAARRWWEPRSPAEAARELLTAAAGVSAAARIGAGDVADGLGEEALAAWRAVERIPELGPHARGTLAAWDQGPSLTPADVRWLAVEHAVAALEGPGPDEALTRVFDRVPGQDLDSRLVAVAGSGHPDAERVAAALTESVSSGAVCSVDQVYRLKVVLPHWRPPIWRRVLVPATTVRLRDVFAGATSKIRYEYDFGASWWHEIVLEKIRKCEPDRVYPVCVAFAGDSPVEYWSEEDPQEAEPFDLAATNRRLGSLNEDVHQ